MQLQTMVIGSELVDLQKLKHRFLLQIIQQQLQDAVESATETDNDANAIPNNNVDQGNL